MARRHHYRRRTKETSDLDITTFMNLMVVLVPFLLLSAVFSRVTVMELSVPTASGGSAVSQPNFNIEVIVRQSGLELANGRAVEVAIPKKDGQYDLKKLTEVLLRLKADYPEKDDATVLMEPDIQYDNLIHVMDTLRAAEIQDKDSDQTTRMVLFPNISIGDAP